MVTFALQARPEDAAGWLALARQAEEIGFESLYVADHPGSCAAPFVALAAAAAVTTRLRLGSYVVNAGVREPILLPRTWRPWTWSPAAGRSSGSAPGTLRPSGRRSAGYGPTCAAGSTTASLWPRQPGGCSPVTMAASDVLSRAARPGRTSRC